MKMKQLKYELYDRGIIAAFVCMVKQTTAFLVQNAAGLDVPGAEVMSCAMKDVYAAAKTLPNRLLPSRRQAQGLLRPAAKTVVMAV
jgi:hypothetical protein